MAAPLARARQERALSRPARRTTTSPPLSRVRELKRYVAREVFAALHQTDGQNLATAA